ncbi:MAG: OmpA family protein [Acidimicrobiia bacterium]
MAQRTVTPHPKRPPPGFTVPDDDDAVMSGGAFGFLVLVAFVVLAVAAIVIGTSWIESDIESRTEGLLAANGLDGVLVAAHGTDVELSGSMQEGMSEEAVFDAVLQLAGVTRVDGKIWIVTADQIDDAVLVGDPIEVVWSNDAAVVSGEISTDERRSHIKSTLAGSFASVDVEELTVVEGIADEKDWIGTVLSLVIAVEKEVTDGRVMVFPVDQLLVVAGEVPDKGLRNALNNTIAEAASKIGFDVNPAIRVPEDEPTKEEVDALQTEINELILDQVVEFEVQSDVITKAGQLLLDGILVKLETAPEIRVEIAGHADANGSAEANMQLSEDRARAVLAYFVAHGQSPDRFDVVWFGESQPIADNNTEEGRARNRRIEFKALYEEEDTP